MPHAYSENTLIEQPAIGLFAGLGWQTVGTLDVSKLDIKTT